MSDIRDLLQFYAEAGADEALEEEPVNRLAQKPARTTVSTLPATPAPERRAAAPIPANPGGAQPPAAVPDEAQAARARDFARSAETLDALRDILAGFEGCNLRYTAKNLVFADGNPQADIMFVGEAPGREEDLSGLPFVGKSGQLLDRMLGAIGLDRDSAYIANVIPWRPPGNRAPTPLETEICRPFIERQIELVNPKVLVTLGGSSSKTILRTTESIMRLRGSWRTWRTPDGVEIPTMPTLHPAYLLRTPAHKSFAWRDLLEVKVRLRALNLTPPSA